jgi:magnesium-protoporphyrin IX monomethyl ester (oxidative) cyclase|uniref:Probable magnesium-protoporphyrin IX monomethyl ester [oxidative] cyclase n=1 Tax=Poterioochromonas malhamensis TaxID=88167 RepID=A0A7T7BWB2_9STRA|nr:magnesium-protoporphyrun IX monomethy ester aerobic oxidative cyclase [Poterioochromonas malhamensis]QQK55038.1 magnesium-protoporphyrun IX monomethy ester aerobic oxidative cyclase [Poterioochromonas malhamensis]
MTLSAHPIEKKIGTKETLLTPRFYTTNFEEICKLNIKENEDEIKAIIEEFRMDYNRDHFIRDKEFNSLSKFTDEKLKKIFIEFLERSCTAEFSGFLLYKEISRNLRKHSELLAEGFSFMARDEARHAGFLNKSMSDFNISLDLGFLTKTRKYTYFEPKFIYYTTYLSEKIGYWRYITIYRHLEKNPNYRVYPLFRFFESWCQDENRHGDFFAALLKSQKNLLNTYESKLWCKFFLLSVFTTMYLNDQLRDSFYTSIGLNTKIFDKYVIKKTNQSAKSLFPVILDVENPKFFTLLDICSEMNKKLFSEELKKDLGIVVFFKKLFYLSFIVTAFAEIYFMPAIPSGYIWNK